MYGIGDSELIHKKHGIRLIKVRCRKGKEAYWVNGNGLTQHFDDYDAELEEYNKRWMQIEYGE